MLSASVSEPAAWPAFILETILSTNSTSQRFHPHGNVPINMEMLAHFLALYAALFAMQGVHELPRWSENSWSVSFSSTKPLIFGSLHLLLSELARPHLQNSSPDLVSSCIVQMVWITAIILLHIFTHYSFCILICLMCIVERLLRTVPTIGHSHTM